MGEPKTRRCFCAAFVALLAAPLASVELPPRLVVTVDLVQTVDADGWVVSKPSGRPHHYTIDGREVSREAFRVAVRRWLPDKHGWVP